MSKVSVTKSYLEDIADSIRAKNGSHLTYKPSQMAEAIDNLPSGSSTLVTKSITENGTYDPADDNADGYSEVTVNVSGGGGSSGVYVGQTEPSSELGNNGDYYYLRIDKPMGMDFTPEENSSMVLSGGLVITTSKAFKIIGLAIFGRTGNTFGNVYLSDINGTELASVTNISISGQQWFIGMLSEPVTIQAGEYVVWGSLDATPLSYLRGDANVITGITCSGALYGYNRDTFPTNTESASVKYGINFIVELDDELVETEYRKKNGEWVQLVM